MDEYLWPVRNIAEYAYCPRLFYLMEVEGIHLASADTEKGQSTHRRVNQPSADASEDEEIDKPKTVRSLSLSSRMLGITGTLDLAEMKGDSAAPVEYRKGRPRHLRPDSEPADGDLNGPAPAAVEPWPTDRVQVALQSILLEEAGYTVDRATIYYAAEKRRVEIEVNQAIRREALDVLESARRCATGPRPPPLVNDPRCAGCSLQPICLPDEINQQNQNAGPPRALWPARDDGIHVVAQQEGVRIGVRGMALRITDRDGGLVREIPLAGVESLALVGSVQLSTQALHVLADRSIPVAYLSSAGRVVAMVDPLDSVSAQVRRAQVIQLEKPAVCLELARALVGAKIANQRTLLMRNAASCPQSALDGLAEQIGKSALAPSTDALRGHEGQAAALYFANFAGMVRSPLAGEFDVNGRRRRPPPDPINAVLSFAYTMLTHECVAALRLARLEPAIGAFHVSRPGRPALALDLMEPFRPLIADSIAIMAFGRGELAEGHFLRGSAGCVMTDSGRRAFFDVYGRRMETQVTHPAFGYKLSYRRMLMLHARMIAAWLAGEVPGLDFLTTR